MAKFNVNEAIAAQRQYCKEKGYPHFAPTSGRCYRCGRNIYEEHENQYGRKTGISVERAGSELITGCPHCCWSYCD